ncbi:MAG: tetratricopeptide repeat protein [Elusimicrobia bacterium]|nr:tetratricopeptide repeat protein [Elusimicrobiota bacterium]
MSLEAGLAAYNAGRHAEAARLLAAPARTDPQAALFLIHALSACGRRKAADAALKRALKEHPDDAALRHGLLLGLAGRRAAEGRWDEARSAYAAALAQRPEDAGARLGFVQACLACGRPAEAARAAAGLTLPPRPAESLALALLNAGLRRAAVGLLERAEPRDAALARLLGETLRRAGRRKEAAVWLTRAAAPGHKPNRDRYAALLLLRRFDDAFREGRRIAAAGDSEDFYHLMNPFRQTLFRSPPPGLEADLARAARRAPNDPWPVMLRLGLLSLAGKTTKALEDARRLRAVAGRAGWMRYLCGHLTLQTTGERALARADFAAALASAPGLWRAEAYLAELALCAGDRRALSRMAGLVARLRGLERAEARAWRGAMLLWLGRAKEAERELDRAVAEGAPFAQAWRGAARVLGGRPNEGLADLDASLARSAPEEEALVWRAEAYRALGDRRRALADVAAALKVNPRSVWAPIVGEALSKEGSCARALLRRAKGVRRSSAYLDALWSRVP